MPARLDPVERERRRKERVKRSFSDAAYQHYDAAKDGFGSADQWKDDANRRFGAEPVAELDADLLRLGLTQHPTSKRALRAAYRLASKSAHPDAGGSEAAFVAIRAAYDRLAARLAD